MLGTPGAYMKSKLYFFSENLTGLLCQKFIQNRLEKSTLRVHLIVLRECLEKGYLQGNDPKHKAKKTVKVFQEFLGGELLTIQQKAQTSTLWKLDVLPGS